MMAVDLKNPKKLIEEICEDQRVMNRRTWYWVTLTAILCILFVGYLYLTVFWLTPSWIIEKPIPFYYQKWFLGVYSSIAVIYLIIYLFVGYRMYREDSKKMEKYKKYEVLMQQD
ncbi:hypothetical protein GCK72_015525 [Caenorhabditis remanei]|uniref:Uncharacterized protein n=1 Tax=Caenorhabditis remanei TaxID=31234 RepID=A0A6A5GX31_CAERE|nr:hypothetical protein GCK72_015525 [Caenorhabditis remanei]KAF1759065.1 hypothetical protein GCK72_015525 [Caenorhabditis remanei]